MSGGSLPWFAHLLVVLAWHIQALAGPGSGYAWAASIGQTPPCAHCATLSLCEPPHKATPCGCAISPLGGWSHTHPGPQRTQAHGVGDV